MTTSRQATAITAVDQPAANTLPSPNGTRALSIDAAWLRTRTELLQDDVRGLHERTRAMDLSERAYNKATSASVPELLDELTKTRGMSWSDLADAIGVSVGAVRKWRKGGAASPASRSNLGRLAALLDKLEENVVVDPAQWMEMRLPLPAGHFIRPLDLYIAGHADALLEIAELRQDPEQVLDRVLPTWRDDRSLFEIGVNSDNERIIQTRGV